jgi:hypothetical protein
MYFQYNWNKLRVLKHTNKIIVGKNPIRRQRGTVLVFVVMTLVVIFGFAGLAIDVGYMMIVRNQLQNAADAAALYGAEYLVNYAVNPVPDFTTAKAKALDAFTTNVQGNVANGVVLTLNGGDIAQFDSGYWDISYPKNGSSSGIQHPSTPPTNENLVPAIKVSIKMNSVINNPINTFFIRVLGTLSYDMGATAVAIAPPSPNCIGEGVLLPVVMNKCAYDSYWNSSTNSPYLAPYYNNNGTIATNDTGYLLGYPYSSGNGKGNTTTGPIETMGTPWVFWLTGSYQADHRPPNGTCEAGQWTSLSTQSNSVNAVRDVIDNFGKANNNTLCTGTGAGHRVYIQPGAETTAYANKNQPSIQTCASKAAGTTGSCAYALIPVIDNDPIATGVWSDVKAFACVHVIKAVGGSDKYIELQMVGETDPNHKYCVAPNSGGGGPNYGVKQPPVLANYYGNTY